MHFFKDSSEAERYATSRPYFHPIAIARAKEAASIETPVSLALDVACGTGHSTTALMALADQLIGIDISFNMLRIGLSETVSFVKRGEFLVGMVGSLSTPTGSLES